MARNAIKTTDEFKIFVEETQKKAGYKNPIGFGIARVDRGQKNSDKILQATYPLINWKENYGSAAVFIASLEEIGIKVDFSGSEFVASIDKEFLECAKALFNPYVDEANGDKHKNIQVVLSILELAESGVVDVTEAFKMVFIFEDEKALNPLHYLKIPQNIYRGDDEYMELGKKLYIEYFETKEDGEYWVETENFFSVIEIQDGEVKYKLNRMGKFDNE
jgi:hypothetical protein